MIFIAIAAVPSLAAAWHPSDRKSRSLAGALGAVLIAVTAGYNLYFLNPWKFRAAESLPLQVCDLLGFAAILAIVANHRLARVIIVLSTIPFVLQAVVTPVGEQKLTSLRTLFYWAFHACIFATFLFEVTIRKFRPDFRDFAHLVLIDLIYVLVIGLLDLQFGWNYGYIGNAKPDTATLLDFLGPWPFRILSISLLAIFMQFICFVIFRSRGAYNDL